jgi:hypothetical protein
MSIKIYKPEGISLCYSCDSGNDPVAMINLTYHQADGCGRGKNIFLCPDCLEELSNQLQGFLAAINKADKLPEDSESGRDEYCFTCTSYGKCDCDGDAIPCPDYCYCGSGANYEGVTK